MTALIRSDVLRNFSELVTELGGDPAALLRKARISPAMLRSGDNFVSFRSVLNLLEHAAESLDCKDLGLRMSVRQDVELFGPLAVAAQHCETLGAAVDCFSKYFHTHTSGLQIATSHNTSENTTQVIFRVLLSRPPAHTQFDERCLLIAHNCLKLASAGAYRPLRMLLPHCRLSSAKAYSQYFDCEVRFDQTMTAVELAASDWRRRIPNYNPQLHLIATAFLDKLGDKPNALLSLRVRDAIKPLLTTGNCSHTDISEALHLHPRTLQRRLADEGSSFETIKDEVRREMAQRYLTTSALPLSQITALLGYSEQSALTRSCQRWFDCKPLALRKAPRGQ